MSSERLATAALDAELQKGRGWTFTKGTFNNYLLRKERKRRRREEGKEEGKK